MLLADVLNICCSCLRRLLQSSNACPGYSPGTACCSAYQQCRQQCAGNQNIDFKCQDGSFGCSCASTSPGGTTSAQTFVTNNPTGSGNTIDMSRPQNGAGPASSITAGTTGTGAAGAPGAAGPAAKNAAVRPGMTLMSLLVGAAAAVGFALVL